MVATADPWVVDAAVATKWHLPDEPDADHALTLLRRPLYTTPWGSIFGGRLKRRRSGNQTEPAAGRETRGKGGGR